MSKERKPDLASDNYQDLEKRVDAIMSGQQVSKDASKRSSGDFDFLPSAPDLPMDDKKLDIKVIRSGAQAPEPKKQVPAAEKKEEIVDPRLVNTGKQANSSADEDQTVFDDAETDNAVKDVISHEGDELIAASDEKQQEFTIERKSSFFVRLKDGFIAWWKHPVKRRMTLLVLGIVIIVAGVVPMSRYAILNAFGVRVSTSLTVIDNSSLQPLRNVEVSVGEQSASTNEDGFVKLEGVRLGNQELRIERRAFAPRTYDVTFGWGSNPLGEYWLQPTGAQYAFEFNDFVSDMPLEKVEVVYEDISAYSNEEGLARLTIDIDNEVSEVEVEVIADGYRSEIVSIDLDAEEQPSMQLVPALRHFFVSERDGSFNVYAADVDGENEEVILEATGAEREDMVLFPHPTKNRVAVISTRDNNRNEDGYLLSSLTIVDLEDNEIITVAESERLQLVDWYDDRIVYVRVAAGASGSNPKRHRLISYDYEQERSRELASSNYFNGVASADGYVYYAPSGMFQTEPVNLYRVKADGTGRESVLDREAWSLHRTAYNTYVVSTSNNWRTLHIDTSESERLDGEPANLQNKLFVENPWNEALRLRAETRDGEGVLFLHRDDQEEEVIAQVGGLSYPLRWLNETTVVYRIETLGETADYAVSTLGGDAVKLQNVTPAKSIDRWYYY